MPIRCAATLRLAAGAAAAAPVPSAATSGVGLRLLRGAQMPASHAGPVSSHPAGPACACAAARSDTIAASRFAITFKLSILCLISRRAWPARADAQLAIPYLIVADGSDLQAGKFLGLTWIFRANAAWHRLAGMPARPGIEQVHQIVRLNKPARHFLIGRVLDFALDP